jgi:hypothetical protein
MKREVMSHKDIPIGMKFELSAEEMNTVKTFIETHHCDYGEMASVACACGVSETLTNFSEW